MAALRIPSPTLQIGIHFSGGTGRARRAVQGPRRGGRPMTRPARDRIVRGLEEAEGSLMLDLPRRALEILQARPDWATMQFEASFLTGEALRELGRFREALR